MQYCQVRKLTNLIRIARGGVRLRPGGRHPLPSLGIGFKNRRSWVDGRLCFKAYSNEGCLQQKFPDQCGAIGKKVTERKQRRLPEITVAAETLKSKTTYRGGHECSGGGHLRLPRPIHCWPNPERLSSPSLGGRGTLCVALLGGYSRRENGSSEGVQVLSVAIAPFIHPTS